MNKQFKQNDNNLAIAYYRFSSHSQNEASIDQQREHAQAFAETHGYRIVNEYEDAAIAAETVKQSLFEDEHSIRSYHDRFLHADFDNAEVRNSVMEYFVDKIYLHEDRLVVASWYSEDNREVPMEVLDGET